MRADTPAVTGLAGACDCHLHVFGPAEQYPAAVEEARIPRGANLESYLGLAGSQGLERLVLVQPSGFGTNNDCLLDALRRLGPSRARGVVMVDEGEVSVERLQEWRSLGVRALRINGFRPDARHHVARADPAELLPTDAIAARIRAQAALAEALGFSLDLLVTGPVLLELLPTLAGLAVPFSVAHLGMFPAEKGPHDPGFARLLEFAAAPPRRCFVKATGSYRLAADPRASSVREMVRALLDTAPDRVIWGSDHPYLGFPDLDRALPFELAAAWLPGEHRHRVLVDNPRALYGFPELSGR